MGRCPKPRKLFEKSLTKNFVVKIKNRASARFYVKVFD